MYFWESIFFIVAFLYFLFPLFAFLVLFRKFSSLQGRMSKLELLLRTKKREEDHTHPSRDLQEERDSLSVNEVEQMEQVEQKERASVKKEYKEMSKDASINWEVAFGGTWLNRIGAIALIFALGFFLKYAFDRQWLNEMVRVCFGGVAGLSLVIAAAYLNRKHKLYRYSQGLLGSGIGILYLSVYASFNFYHFISLPMAYVLMSMVTLLTIWQAVQFQSLTVSILGLIGGYSTPLLLWTSSENHIFLYSYLTMLTLGLLLIGLRNEKFSIAGYVAMFINYLYMFGTAYYAENTVILLFLTLLWFVVYLVDCYLQTRSMKWEILHFVMGIVNVYFFTSLFYDIFLEVDQTVWHLALLIFILGTMYLIPLAVCGIRDRMSPLGKGRYVLTFLVLATVALYTQWTGYALVIACALEIFILMWLGAVKRIPLLNIFAFFLGVLTTFMLVNFSMLDTLMASSLVAAEWVVNVQTTAYLLMALVLAAGAYWMGQMKGEKAKVYAVTLHSIWTILVFIWLSLEVDLFFEVLMPRTEDNLLNMMQLTLSATWLLYATILFVLGRMREVVVFRMVALALFGLSTLKIFLYDLNELDVLYRIGSFLVLGVILLGVSFLYQRREKEEQIDTGGEING